MMKKIIPYINLCLVVLLTGCVSSDVGNDNQNFDHKLYTSNYIALTVPTIYTDTIKYFDTSDQKLKTKKVTDVKLDNSLLHSFTDISSSVTMYESNREGTLTLLGNKATLKNSKYVVIYDFTQTQTITPHGDSIKKSIGIAVRMIAEVKIKKKGIDISDVFKLGIYAKDDNIEGVLAVRSIGISSQKVNQAIPTPTDLSPASIATALQSVATIKSHIYDNETKIAPHLIGISIPAKTTKDEVKAQLNTLNL